MKTKKITALILLAALLILPGCKKEATGSPIAYDNTKPGAENTLPSGSDTVPNVDIPNQNAPIETDPEATADIPSVYLAPMKKLLAEWGLRKGSMSDPLIGARILMYDKTKDEVGYAILDIDGNGVDEMIVAPIDEFKTNGLVYDILTMENDQAWHLANSLQATYHFMSDGSFILRTPTENKSYTFKRVTLNGTDKPTEVSITKDEAAKYYISTVELTPFSKLEK